MKKLFLDCDGVLADPRRHVVEVLGLNIDPTFPGKYEFEDWIPEHADDAHRVMSAPEFWLTLPTIEGAMAGMQRLRDRNCDITILTSPYKRCPMWFDARIEWLDRNFKVDRDDIIFARKKLKVTGGDIMVDDHIDHVTEWENAQPNGRAYLFTAPHNVMIPRLQRVDWSTIDRIF